MQSDVELLTLSNTHPSVDYLWIPCPRLHQVAVVVEVAKAELHPVFYVVVETLHFPNLVFIGERSPQCNGAPSSSLLSRNEHPSCSRLAGNTVQWNFIFDSDFDVTWETDSTLPLPFHTSVYFSGTAGTPQRSKEMLRQNSKETALDWSRWRIFKITKTTKTCQLWLNWTKTSCFLCLKIIYFMYYCFSKIFVSLFNKTTIQPSFCWNLFFFPFVCRWLAVGLMRIYAAVCQSGVFSGSESHLALENIKFRC